MGESIDVIGVPVGVQHRARGVERGGLAAHLLAELLQVHSWPSLLRTTCYHLGALQGCSQRKRAR
jgi:hypothetical protein